MQNAEALRLHEVYCSGCSEYGGHKRLTIYPWQQRFLELLRAYDPEHPYRMMVPRRRRFPWL